MFGRYGVPTGIVEGIPHFSGKSWVLPCVAVYFYPIITCPLFSKSIWRIPFPRQSGSRLFQNSPILQALVEKKKHHNRCLESFLAHLPGPVDLVCNLPHSWGQGDFESCFTKQVNEVLLILQQKFTKEKYFHLRKKSLFQQNQSRENIWANLMTNNIEIYFGGLDSVMRWSRGSSVTIHKILRDIEIGSGILQWKFRHIFLWFHWIIHCSWEMVCMLYRHIFLGFHWKTQI